MTQLHTPSQLPVFVRSSCYSSVAPTPLYGTDRKPKATGVSKPNHSAESLNEGSPTDPQLKHQSRVPGVGHTAARGHLDEAAIGIKFEHRLRVGGADFSELGRGEAERAGQTDHTETDIVLVDDGLVVAAAGRAAVAGVADPGAAAQQLLFVSSRSGNQPGLVITLRVGNLAGVDPKALRFASWW